MQMAIDVAGFTPAQSDELRQAMGSKRSAARMERLKERLFAGMAERGITGDVAEELFMKMKAFANYGFPESHSVSFAYLVYASSWIKYHEPAAFCAALLNAQPMGFWSPHTLVRDARRHGVVVHTPDLNVVACSGDVGAVRFVTERGRGAAGDRLGARDRVGAGRRDRGDPHGGRTVRRHRRPRAASAVADVDAAGGDGDRWVVRRVLRSRSAHGAVDRRRDGPVATRAVAGSRHR